MGEREVGLSLLDLQDGVADTPEGRRLLECAESLYQ
jgi:DNA-binding transcriptional LysR family regulator